MLATALALSVGSLRLDPSTGALVDTAITVVGTGGLGIATSSAALSDVAMTLAATGGEWDPSQILSSLALWLRADMGITLNGSNVSAWADQGSNGNNASQGTSADQPAFVSSSSNVGNKASISYTASVPDFLSVSNAASLQLTGDMYVAAVMYVTSYPAGFATVISKGSVSEYDIFIQNSGAFKVVKGGTTVSYSASAPTATRYLISYNQASGTGTAYLNGTSVGTGSPSTPSTTTNPVRLGARSDSGTTLNGEQPEIVLVNRALTGTELTNMHRYFGNKYGISVP